MKKSFKRQESDNTGLLLTLGATATYGYLYFTEGYPYFHPELHTPFDTALFYLHPLIVGFLAKTAFMDIPRIAYEIYEKTGGDLIHRKQRKLAKKQKNPKNTRLYLKEVLKSYVALTQNNQAQDHLKKAIQADPNESFPHLMLAKLEPNRAFSHLRAASQRKKPITIPLSPHFFTVHLPVKYHLLKTDFKEMLRQDIPAEEYLKSALYLHLFNEERRAVTELDKAVQRGDLEVKIFAADLMETIIDNSSFLAPGWIDFKKRLWENITGEVLKGKELTLLSESKNKVYEIKGKDFLTDTFVFKEGSKTSLEGELEMCTLVKEIAEKYHQFTASKTLAIIDHEDKQFAIIRREPGVSLLEKINEGKDYKTYFERIVPVLAAIHTFIPKELVVEKENPQKAFEEKLRKINVSEDLKEKLLNHYQPISLALKDSFYVYNKDAHPLNWYITESGVIAAIDCEKSRQVPQTYDLVNLLEFGRYFNKEEKKILISSYVQEFNSLNEDKIAPTFRLEYLNALIHRAVYISSYLQGKVEKQQLQKDLLQNAKEAIGKIRKEYSEYYNPHRVDYIALYLGLRQLMVQGIEQSREIQSPL